MKYTINVLLILLSITAFAQPEADKPKEPGIVVDKIIVKVDNYIVLKSDLESAYQGYVGQGNPAPKKPSAASSTALWMNKLMVAKAGDRLNICW
ncbi:MAG: hypothetical protein WDO15_09860 [Bacteroidota bacterium]